VCNAHCSVSGELTIEGQSIAVFQCDECEELLDLGDGGVPLQTALTFGVDDAGDVHRNLRDF